MKYLITSLILVSLLMGCSALFRGEGETYLRYPCRESLMHFYSHCSEQKLTKEEFEALVKTCEEGMKSKICDKEQADLLWCQGRVVPGVYSQGGGFIFGKGFAIPTGGSSTIDGCDCSAFTGALRECRMKQGIFDK